MGVSFFFFPLSLFIPPPLLVSQICETLLLPAVLCAGSTRIFERLDSLEETIGEGFEAAVNTISSKQAIDVARNYRFRLRVVTLAYDDLVEDIILAAGSEKRKFSSLAKDSSVKAEMRAEELYAWAEGFIPNTGNDQAGLSKKAKLGLMPYIVALAYAMRVKTDARLVRSHSIVDAGERQNFLERSRKSMSDFIHVLRVVVAAVVTTSNLLEIALDYHLAMATYMMLITSLKTSMQLTLGPAKESLEIELWDDGLSKIR